MIKQERQIMVNSKNTKAEILEAYHQLEQEKSDLLSQIKQLQQQPKTPPSPPPLTIKPTSEHKPLNTTTPLVHSDIQQTIGSLETIKLGFGSAVSNLSEKLIAEATKLAAIKAEVAEQINQLKDLHDIQEISETTLDDLITEYQSNSKNYLEELTQQQEYLQQQLLELHQNWDKEKQTHQREIQERNQNHQKEINRNEQEYQYNLQQERLLTQEQFEQQKQALFKELAEIKQQQEKLWQQREETIAKKEFDYAEAQQKVIAFEEQLQAKIKQAENEGKAIGNYQVKIKADLRNKEIEGEKHNYQLRIDNLQNSIHNNQNRIDSLSRQLEAALKQVQDLAVKAIEGSSNRNSYEAMKEIALEQAKNTQKGK